MNDSNIMKKSWMFRSVLSLGFTGIENICVGWEEDLTKGDTWCVFIF